jgi:hypothetical protein
MQRTSIAIRRIAVPSRVTPLAELDIAALALTPLPPYSFLRLNQSWARAWEETTSQEARFDRLLRLGERQQPGPSRVRVSTTSATLSACDLRACSPRGIRPVASSRRVGDARRAWRKDAAVGRLWPAGLARLNRRTWGTKTSVKPDRARTPGGRGSASKGTTMSVRSRTTWRVVVSCSSPDASRSAAPQGGSRRAHFGEAAAGSSPARPPPSTRGSCPR